jgi:aspartate racemase
MKTLGLIGGMSWLSTAEYYRIINQTVQQRLGGSEAARLILHSLNLAEVAPLMRSGDWQGLAERLVQVARSLERSGAEALIICANTPHRVAPDIESSIGIPLIHIADATARAIRLKRVTRVATLGTRATMEETFFSGRLAKAGIGTIIPEKADRDFIHDSIFNEFDRGMFLPATRDRYKGILAALAAKGAQGIVLGCTEIPLIVKQKDSSVPLFDTALVHAVAAAEFALEA